MRELQTTVKDLFSRMNEEDVRKSGSEYIAPPCLKKGGTIGVVAPSSAFDPEYVARAIAYLKKKGYKVKLGDTVRNLYDRDLTAAGDKTRAADVMKAFTDPDVDAIFTATGGYGSIRTIKHLNFDVIRKNPKIMVGFSDTTGILNVITSKSKIITFVGPSMELGQDDEVGEMSMDSLLEMISKPVDRFELTFPKHLSMVRELPTHRNGMDKFYEGTLFGGNLTLISNMIGTPYCIPKLEEGLILALEEISEPAYEIDSKIQQLEDSGVLHVLTPVLLGEFVKIVAETPSSRKEEEAEISVSSMLRQRFAEHQAPVLSGWLFSHGKNWNMTLPIGAKLRIDPAALTVTVLSPVVL